MDDELQIAQYKTILVEEKLDFLTKFILDWVDDVLEIGTQMDRFKEQSGL